MTILLIDNYDSFTYNLAQYIGPYAKVVVKRNDEVDARAVQRMRPKGIVISPGPGHPANPADFGACTDVLRDVSPHVPTLGVCLGHQGIVHAYGGKVVHARAPLHGKVRRIRHDGQGVFQAVPNPLQVVRYHSLVADPASLPKTLKVTTRDAGEIMGVRHTEFPIEGVQFHPESVGTDAGHKMIHNFVDATRRRRA